MTKKTIAFFLGVFLVATAHAEEKSPNRVVSERLIARIDFYSWIQESFIVSPDSKRVAYVAKEGDKLFVVVDGKEGKHYDNIVTIEEEGLSLIPRIVSITLPKKKVVTCIWWRRG